MPLSAMVTPLSLYMQDNTIFNSMSLPQPPTNPTDYPDLFVSGFMIDRDLLIENLLLETGELNVIYPDPVFFKYAVTSWSQKQVHVWQQVFNTLFYKYNPLWNKDGTIKETAQDVISNLTTGSKSRAGANNQSMTDSSGDTEESSLSDVHVFDSSTERREDGSLRGAESNDLTRQASESKAGSTASSGEHESGTDGVQTTDTITGSGEESSTSRTGRTTGTTDTTGTETESFSESEGGHRNLSSVHSGGTVTENQVSAYNDNSYVNRDKTTLTDTQAVTDTEATGKSSAHDGTKIETGSEARYEDQSGSESATKSGSGSSSESSIKSETSAGTDRSSGTTEEQTDTLGTESSVRAEDQQTSSEQHQGVSDSDITEHSELRRRSGSGTRTSSGTDNDQEDSVGTSDGTQDHTLLRIEQGNIGLTTTMQLIQEQRELVKLNIYDLIIEEFKERFCLLVY